MPDTACSHSATPSASDVLLIASKNGLYLVYGQEIRKLLIGEFYGITKYQSAWLIFEKRNKKGRILCMNINNTKKCSAPKVLIRGLSEGCHQIDVVGTCLYITDTYNNAIIEYSLTEKRVLREYFPTTRLKDGRKDPNYNHINSIFYQDSKFYLLAHNETSKTGRNSEILICNQGFDLLDRVSTKGVNAHNIIVLENDLYFCNSMHNALHINDERKITFPMFTRGLAISEDQIYVGGSEYGAREIREKLNGAVYIVSQKEYAIMRTIPIPGMVQEIRIVNRKDYGLSQHE